jgi:O-acetyl-ADP-ribose deacetylase (regulator of RNase III)
MAILSEVKENLLDIKSEIIAHGCNCFHTMGAGIALALQKKYSVVLEADLKTKKGDSLKLGTFSLAKAEDKEIYNLYTQYRYGRERRHLNYEALYNSLSAMNSDICARYQMPKVLAIPRIGCGLAGGDWEIVKKIIERTIDDKHTVIVALGDLKE